MCQYCIKYPFVSSLIKGKRSCILTRSLPGVLHGRKPQVYITQTQGSTLQSSNSLCKKHSEVSATSANQRSPVWIATSQLQTLTAYTGPKIICCSSFHRVTLFTQSTSQNTFIELA